MMGKHAVVATYDITTNGPSVCDVIAIDIFYIDGSTTTFAQVEPVRWGKDFTWI